MATKLGRSAQLAILLGVASTLTVSPSLLGAVPRAGSPESHRVWGEDTPGGDVPREDGPEGEAVTTTPIRMPAPKSPPRAPKCVAYQMDFLQFSGDHRNDNKRQSFVSLDHSRLNGLSCLTDLINQTNSQIGRSYKKQMKYKNNILSQYYRGDRHGHLYGYLFSNLFWKNIKRQTGFRVDGTGATGQEIAADNEQARSMMSCVEGEVLGGHGQQQIGGAEGGKPTQIGCIRGSLFLDENCRLVDQKSVDPDNICDKFDYFAQLATPLSLVWRTDYADKPATLVSFKLNPHSKDSVWMWRASESLPLLVYDPDHSGVITSANQLFGNWTFGGKELAARTKPSSVGTPWRDGYEALSTLDKNLDDKVSGEELSDLGLWFDRNQDGVTQTGEVIALSELQITSLYYVSDTEEKGALVATKGYERIVDGESFVGRSLDWSEKSLRDGFDVVIDKTSKMPPSTRTSVEANTDTTASVVDPLLAEAIEGVWNWNLDLPAKGSGLLSFAATDEGMWGTTVTQVGIAGIPKVASNVLFAHFEGRVKKSENDLVEVHFTHSESDGATLVSSAVLSKKKDKLVGKTIVKNSALSQSGSYEYTWTAERLMVKAE